MKRFLSIFITLALLLTILAIPTSVSAASDGIAWVYEFNAASKVNGHATALTGATIGYDKENNAMTVNAGSDATSNSTMWTMYSSVANVDTTVYPYVAMRVKSSKEGLSTCRARMQPATSNNPTWGSTLYADTDEWQTVYFQVSLLYDGLETKTYSKINVTMADWMGSTVNIADTFYVAWIGGFKTISDINLYSGEVNKFDGANVISFDSARKATSLDTVTNNIATTDTIDGVKTYVYDTVDAISYDTANNALLVTPKITTGDHNVMVDCSALGISAADYPIVAYKAKWTQTAIGTFTTAGKTAVASHITAKTASNVTATTNNNNGNSYGPEYSGTGLSGVKTDWQIAYGDFSASGLSSTYSLVTLDVIGYRTYQTQGISENLPIYIEWVGFFATLEDAYAYDTECAIDDISYTITTGDKDEIESVNTMYEALDTAYQAKVSNYSDLTDANAVSQVVTNIDERNTACAEKVAYEDCAEIEATWQTYQDLSHALRQRVGNLDTMTTLNTISGIVHGIGNLPDTITYAQGSTLTSIEEKYTSLPDTDKARVSNYQDYLTAKAAYDAVMAADVGDIDCDGDVDICDLVVLHLFVADSDVTVITNPNLNGDDTVDAADMAVLRQTIINK